MTTKQLAESGARKICGMGKCHFPFDCGHPNREGRTFPKIGDLTECPLAKYHVEPDTKPRNERTYAGTTPTRDEIWALCSQCPQATTEPDGGKIVVRRLDLMNCADCPVKGCEEALQERAAEAAGG